MLFTLIGLITINPKQAYPLSVATKQAPSFNYPFGTDFFGRNRLLRGHGRGPVAERHHRLSSPVALGTFISVVLGFISAYFGGLIDFHHPHHLPDPAADPIAL